MDLDELVRAYWAAPPYEFSEGSEEHPWELINEVLDSNSDVTQSAMLRALAVSAPDQRKLAYIGTWCVEDVESERGDDAPGRSVRLLLAAGLESGALEPEQIVWLTSRTAPDRREWL